MSPDTRPDPLDTLPWSAMCDWGNCDRPSICIRLSTEDYAGWVPVCIVHAVGATDDELAPMRDVSRAGVTLTPPQPDTGSLDAERLTAFLVASAVHEGAHGDWPSIRAQAEWMASEWNDPKSLTNLRLTQPLPDSPMHLAVRGLVRAAVDEDAALRSTPAAPHQHRFDVVIRDDEHMRLLGCSNTPCEEAYQWDR